MPAGTPRRRGGARAHRRADRLGHRRPQHHRRDRARAGEARPAPGQPVLHPGQPDQPGQRPGLDPVRLQGPEPRGGDRLLDRRARDRRRQPDDRARRCRRDGRRRRRGGGLPARHGRLRRRAGAVDRFQRHAGAGVAALGRDRDGFVMGEGAGVRGARGARARASAAAPRSMPRSRATACRATPITSPRPAPRATAASARCRRRCARAGLRPSEIDYINAHGTRTPLGDEIELGAVKRLFGEAAWRCRCRRPSRRSAICSGAAGSVEAIFASWRSATRSCRRP